MTEEDAANLETIRRTLSEEKGCDDVGNCPECDQANAGSCFNIAEAIMYALLRKRR